MDNLLKVLNLILVAIILGSAFKLVNQRYQARNYYMQLSQLQNKTEGINKEYTRLEIEEGTYSSGLAIQDYAVRNLGLVPADKQHVLELK
jgi:cell division protein FtsL